MKCSVFIATSVDGFIAKKNGSVDWLQTAGNLNTDMGDQADMGFNQYIASVDCIIMGRKCMEIISSMNLSPEQWPYGNTRIIVLSSTLTQAPDNLKDKIEMYAGDISALVTKLNDEGYQHAYIDGGMTIQAFINQQLINDITITRAPILLGSGISLFGETHCDIALQQTQAIVYPNDFIQVKYCVHYK
ncbi:dihydrofolate reductase [Photobacterium carnosum]|uniref:dihydrofolate reductase family protein n=1 Tax=Photobacterium carnosum TaxID=2023717 RepID=UPI001C918BD7|nr:dihydrofolate reductase family protein [Photobacterium carnosum]MBY3790177.1 dihydrofolate reductase [Photobacterium carnosum]MCD9535242.1 dihydrofolate reductase [Photobacterium carnosum]